MGLPEMREYRRPTEDPSVEEAPPPFVEEVLNAVLDGLGDEYVAQVVSRQVGVIEKHIEPGFWGLLSAETWSVSISYFDNTGEFEINAAVHKPQDDYDEWWTYTGEETTGEMGRIAAEWLNANLNKVH